jgi:hypothetical protein
MKMRGEGKHETWFSSHLKAAFEADLGGSLPFKLSESIIYGVPDIVLPWNKKTTWWEVKKVKKNGKIIQKEIQHYNMNVLSDASEGAFYVLFDFKRQQTAVVHPAELWSYLELGAPFLNCSEGVDFRSVVEFARRYHS